MELRAAHELHDRLSRANPHLVYEVKASRPLGEPSFYVRVASRAEPAPRRPRRIGPETAVAARGHAELDAQLALAA